LQDLPVKTPIERPENQHIYHLYVIQVSHRDQLQTFLKERGVFTGIHYPVPIHLQNALETQGNNLGDLPVTEQITSEILSLPMYAELTDEQINYVVECIKEFAVENLKLATA
jgi:dTDP-4-amino-4,6-dideoxygalactose transaminase